MAPSLARSLVGLGSQKLASLRLSRARFLLNRILGIPRNSLLTGNYRKNGTLLEIETGDVKQTPEALQSWINGLRERSGGGWVAIAVEQSRGALLYALLDYDFVLIYPINPKSLSRYRTTFLRP